MDETLENEPQNTPAVEKKEDGGYFKVFIVTLLIAGFIRLFIAQPFVVSGNSMIPTFSNGDYLIVDQVTYLLGDPKRGDVVIFQYPQNPKKFFIKRIVGLPGETVRMEDGKTLIEKEGEILLLDDPFITSVSSIAGLSTNLTLKEGEYFVAGDNRNVSSDSRTWGPVAENLIVGRAIARFIPITEAAFLPGEFTFETN